MFYQQPPVGNPIDCSVADHPDHFLKSFFSPFKSRYFDSGTAALAAAITAAIHLKPVSHPEVVLPAYACPDLVSAVVFAGAKPVLVDLAPDRPWMDLEQLTEKMNAQTVAVVAVNLFGVLERMEDLRALTTQAEVVLIEDSAQAFPGGAEKGIWSGDLVVLSFGRGKPVSLLGGGAVLYREEAFEDLLAGGEVSSAAAVNTGFALRLKAAIYNTMVSPRLYWLPQALPFLHLGETIFHPLHGIDSMEGSKLAILPANIQAYQDDDMAVQTALTAVLGELDLESSGIIDLPRLCQISKYRRLLRYPLLVDQALRPKLLSAFRRLGQGVSEMYPAALPGISGLENQLSGQGAFPAAESFSARILTLPTHTGITADDLAIMRDTLKSGG